MKSHKITPNNFDLIRLLAASQVVVHHFWAHFASGAAPVVLRFFPGVPAFYFVSGFLISASWERIGDLKVYAINRGLRIFPALWLAVALTGLFVFATGAHPSSVVKLISWLFAQTTVLQDYHPHFVHNFRDTALWTISIEVQFYVVLPALYWLIAKTRIQDFGIVAIAILSFAILHAIGAGAIERGPHGVTTVGKLILRTALPWLGMFCTGIMAQRYSDVLIPLVRNRAHYLLVAYIGARIISQMMPIPGVFCVYPSGNFYSIGTYVFYALLILSLAYTGPKLAERFLHRNDISYGIYVYHMPLINLFVFLRLSAVTSAVLLAIVLPPLAWLSWQYVESRALRLKSKALYVHEGAQTDARSIVEP